MTIHGTNPFAIPDDARSPLRRLRGRLPVPVTLWTAYGRDDRPAGLTVTSMLVADGEPGQLAGLLDEESELYAAAVETGRLAVHVLRDGAAQLADRFAGLLPAPGGLFAQDGWRRTPFGPVRVPGRTWVGASLTQARPLGYAMLVVATIDQIEPDDPTVPVLMRLRGRYHAGPQL